MKYRTLLSMYSSTRMHTHTTLNFLKNPLVLFLHIIIQKKYVPNCSPCSRLWLFVHFSFSFFTCLKKAEFIISNVCLRKKKKLFAQSSRMMGLWVFKVFFKKNSLTFVHSYFFYMASHIFDLPLPFLLCMYIAGTQRPNYLQTMHQCNLLSTHRYKLASEYICPKHRIPLLRILHL